MSDIIPQKRCNKCGEEKPATADYFHRNQGGLRADCKICVSKRMGFNPRDRLAVVPDGHKRCRDCKQSLLLAQFHKDKSKKGGLCAYCKDCLRNRQGYKKKKTLIAPDGFKYCYCCEALYTASMDNFGIIRKTGKLESHCRKCIQVKSREQRAKNKDLKREQTRKYRQSHQHLYNAAAERRRARKRQLLDTFTTKHWELCFEYWRFRCAVCGNQLRDLFGEIKPHADHWIPLSSPNCVGTTPDNMVCLCNDCNHAKHARDPELWLVERYGKSKARQILDRVKAYFEWIVNQ